MTRNMSYCRWRNTLEDFRDCEEHVVEELDSEEGKARKTLLTRAAAVLAELGVEIDQDELTAAIRSLPVEKT